MKNILNCIHTEIAAICNIPSDITFLCEYPRDSSHGDFATNLAMVSSKYFKKQPMLLAEDLSSKIRKLPFVRECSIAKPGFININVHEQYLISALKECLLSTFPNIGKGEKVNIEYVSANPTGPLHVGHLRGAIYGDVLASLLQKTGYNVTKEYYINDAGNQIHILAKSVWIRYRQLLGDKIEVPDGCYPAEYIIDIAKKIRHKYGDNLQENDKVFFEYPIQFNMRSIKSTLKKLKIIHDVFSSEKKIVDSNAISEAINDLQSKGLVYRGIPEKPHNASDKWQPMECLLFKAKHFGDTQDRVLQKNDGSYTYCVPDMVYNRDKISRGFNNLVMVLGADHIGYVSRLKAMTQALTEKSCFLDIKICQVVKFLKNDKTFKMSKRAGTFVTVDDILKDVHPDIIRFTMLTKKNDIHMDFDTEKVKEQTKDNPLFYIQYAYSRISSILRKSSIKTINFDELQCNKHFIPLIKKVLEFPSVLHTAVKNHEPHHIAFFGHFLASELHRIWTVGNSTPEARFLITKNNKHNQMSINILLAVKKILDYTFEIFDIEPLETM